MRLHSTKGFTLIELMVVILLTAIMAAIAFPSMSNWMASRKVANRSEQVLNMIRLAKAEAVRLNTPVYVCPVSIASTGIPNGYCSTALASAKGFASFGDSNANLQYDAANDLALRTVVINTSDRSDIQFNLGNFTTAGASGAAATAFGFMPDGSFYRATSASGVLTRTRADGVIKISLTDANAGDKKADRAVVLLIDGGGHVRSCSTEQIKASAASSKACSTTF